MFHNETYVELGEPILELKHALSLLSGIENDDSE